MVDAFIIKLLTMPIEMNAEAMTDCPKLNCRPTEWSNVRWSVKDWADVMQLGLQKDNKVTFVADRYNQNKVKASSYPTDCHFWISE